ncbi:winged helix-turn-helix transcriptional regulator [Candidatus Desantisbacteria bacterium]|nr:winged helix-turn-helix transcriptional regulator [Candidatus Desantisbacteria bacterium]
MKDVGGSQSNVSHAMSTLYKLGLVTHPDKRVRYWTADSSNELVRLMEKLLFVSGNNPAFIITKRE